MPLAPAQCRAGRALIGWSVDALATETGLPAGNLAGFEDGKIVLPREQLDLMRNTFELAGIEFIGDAAGEGIGVKLRRPAVVQNGIRPQDLNAANDD